MSVTKDDVKKALNLDGDDDDSLISAYIKAAEIFIKNAIGEDKSDKFYVREEITSLLNVAIISLAGSYYTYRISLADTQNYSVDLTLNSIIGQLRGKYALFLEEGETNG
ncbi:head-tail connector protein [Streptococcus phage phiKSM96]|nr:head-tail connector protein [Streptococcus mutans]WGL32726.1 head-tail connector protein [Streptococcus phage phiKSM96]